MQLTLHPYTRDAGYVLSLSLPFLIVYTIFIGIVAVATINFSLAWVRPLIEGGSYSREAFINLGLMLGSVVHVNHSTEDWFTKIALQVIEI